MCPDGQKNKRQKIEDNQAEVRQMTRISLDLLRHDFPNKKDSTDSQKD